MLITRCRSSTTMSGNGCGVAVIASSLLIDPKKIEPNACHVPTRRPPGSVATSAGVSMRSTRVTRATR